jgi:hypothetical protein
MAGGTRQTHEHVDIAGDLMAGLDARVQDPGLAQGQDDGLDGLLHGLLPLGNGVASPGSVFVGHEALGGGSVGQGLTDQRG